MSEIPPQGQGWIDSNGYQQAGIPPTGYWQASDGRWYAPELAAPAYVQPQPSQAPEAVVDQGAPTQAMPGGEPQHFPPQDFGTQPYAPGPGFQAPAPGPGPGPQQFPTGPPPGPQQFSTAPGPQLYPGGQHSGQPPSTGSSRTGLWIVLGVAGVLLVGIVALGAFLVVGDDDDESTAGSTTTVVDDDTTVDDDVDDTTATTEDTTDLVTDSDGSGTGDVVSCSKVDDETVVVEVVNSSSELSNYFLTIAFFDDSGSRLSDTSGYITALRPGERSIEESYIFDEPGATCEVIDVERVTVQQDAEALSDVSTCEVTGADFVDDVMAEISATNSANTNSDYSVDVAILDADGVRRGTGYAYIETVRPGETAPSEIFTTVDYSDDAVCDVVAVIRTES
ncbi:MAG: hypothetical protein GY773_13240 [Actinomycetia bacterium]|nr:hypothetical protein [Actinomycetes bacterium]